MRTMAGSFLLQKESPAALYDRAAGARWGIYLSENNHKKTRLLSNFIVP